MLGAIAGTVALGGCSHSNSPDRMTEDTTRAVYAGDRDAAVANFDDTLKGQVTRAQVGAMSDAMHMLGAYHGVRLLQSNADAGRYDYEADFDKGKMLVMVRVDPSGRLGAYRISPTQ
jgi:hypothetical protein